MAKETYGTIGCPTCDEAMPVSKGGSGKAAAYCTECGTQVLTRTGIGSRQLLERAQANAPAQPEEPEHGEEHKREEEPEPAPADAGGAGKEEHHEQQPAAGRRRGPGRFI